MTPNIWMLIAITPFVITLILGIIESLFNENWYWLTVLAKISLLWLTILLILVVIVVMIKG